jgi:hypothetical protein
LACADVSGLVVADNTKVDKKPQNGQGFIAFSITPPPNTDQLGRIAPLQGFFWPPKNNSA